MGDTEAKEGKTRMFRGGELSSQAPRMIGLGEFADFLSWNQDAIGDSPRRQPPVCDHVIHTPDADGEYCGSFSAADEQLRGG